ncbi:hypothetical protein [Dictyobacter arantiisoli]|uniref:Uncharacterized protein n=1 Tax=Dictyobacter arantiisoli TaxID=2014874 RepID=A0A5A5T8U6_9CHLR|nr:hypothetical protein [Dictyobacter arantiisoli]GCF07910.1 hypothetical protein KDI_14740 [Dictyobacter arantiisoli]
MPQVTKRHDPQAEMMKENADPLQVLTYFQENYDKTVQNDSDTTN